MKRHQQLPEFNEVPTLSSDRTETQWGDRGRLGRAQKLKPHPRRSSKCLESVMTGCVLRVRKSFLERQAKGCSRKWEQHGKRLSDTNDFTKVWKKQEAAPGQALGALCGRRQKVCVDSIQSNLIYMRKQKTIYIFVTCHLSFLWAIKRTPSSLSLLSGLILKILILDL